MGYIYSGSLVGMVVGGYWADRWSRRSPRARIWVGVIGVLVATPAILLVANVSVLPMVLLGLVVYGFARPFPDANMVPILCQIVDRRFLATGVGVLNTFAVFVGGATIYAGGALRDAKVDITTVFNCGAAGLVICAVLLWFVREPAVKPATPMKYVQTLTRRDEEIARARLSGFLPSEIFDIHTHPFHPGHFPPGEWAFLNGLGPLGCTEHRAGLQRYMPVQTVHGLYFGMPRRTADHEAMNTWVASEVRDHGTPLSRALRVVAPTHDQANVAASLRDGRFVGIKVYHCYAPRPDTMNARVEEYAPEWMWELLNETRGVLMLLTSCATERWRMRKTRSPCAACAGDIRKCG